MSPLLAPERTSHQRRLEGVESILLRAGKLHDLGPFLGFVGNELPEIGRGAEKGFAAEIGEPSPHSGVAEGSVDLGVELVDDLCRRVVGRADPLPRTRLVAWYKFANCGDIGQRL